MSDKDDKTGKARRPLTDFDNLKFANMNATEFEQAKNDVFAAMRAKAKRIERENERRK